MKLIQEHRVAKVGTATHRVTFTGSLLAIIVQAQNRTKVDIERRSIFLSVLLLVEQFGGEQWRTSVGGFQLKKISEQVSEQH